MSYKKIEAICKKAKQASYSLNVLTTQQKNRVLKDLATSLVKNAAAIIKANQKDLVFARKKGLSAAMIDRLVLNKERIADMSSAVKEVAALKDPVGEVIDTKRRAGLKIKKVCIPLGVIGMIYESRPNVTVDAAALCFKSGNAIVLRGGSEAFHSNTALVKIIAAVLKKHKIPSDVVSMVPFTDRKALEAFVAMDAYLDVLIPRGGEGLMRFISEHARVPVIKHDKGVCSLFVDESAKLLASVDVVFNAKVQRPGVCNALESLYVHKKVAPKFLPLLMERFFEAGVVVKGDAAVRRLVKGAKPVKASDFSTEYLDLVISVKVVKDVHEAIENVIAYSSNHTDGILTESRRHADLYVRSLTSSCVVVNASTRFNDGGQLGLGAEIGISTTKLHAYGPMGLGELVTARFVVEGEYKIRK